MPAKKTDRLAEAVEARRRVELAALERELVAKARADRHAASTRTRFDAKRSRLATIAERADPILHAWIRSDRFDLALRARPTAERRTVNLPGLWITDRGPRFWREPGCHHVSRGEKVYVVSIGERLSFNWRACASPGFGGAGEVAVRPRSFGELASLDLAHELPSWQAGDVLHVAMRIADEIAARGVEALVAEALRA